MTLAQFETALGATTLSQSAQAVMIAMAESVEGAGSYDLVSYSGTSTASATYTGGVYLVTFAISPA